MPPCSSASPTLRSMTLRDAVNSSVKHRPSGETMSATSGFIRAPWGSCCKGGLKHFFSPCGSPCIIVPFLLTVTVLPWSLTLIKPIKPNPFHRPAGGNIDNNVLVHLELKYIPHINCTCYFMFTNTQCAVGCPSSPTSH